jgi:hypothetical protein
MTSVVTGSPTFAKGPSQGVIDGPGFPSPVALREPGEATIGPEHAAMVQKSGFLDGLWCRTCDRRLFDRPPGELGPRYTVIYTMTVTVKDRTRSSEVIQFVFPYATPRPVTYMPSDQRFWGRERTVGGWFVARSGLRDLFADLKAEAAGATSAGEPRTVSGRPGAERGHLLIWVWAAAAVASLTVASAILREHHAARRRRAPGSRSSRTADSTAARTRSSVRSRPRGRSIVSPFRNRSITRGSM